ncbi:Methyltransferase domain protein [compost metagenome]
MTEPVHHALKSHYEACLDAHGDSHLGVNWSRPEDAETRHEVMLDMIRPADGRRLSVLDFGCGASHFYEYLHARGRDDIDYTGLDISEKFIALSQAKYPGNAYMCMDFLRPDADLPAFDYVVMNGVFTNRTGMTHAQMEAFFTTLVAKLFPHARVGLAFNAMTKHVDWERDDLFHLPFDTLAAFLKAHVSRRFVIRSDYGLYDYTTYVYR